MPAISWVKSEGIASRGYPEPARKVNLGRGVAGLFARGHRVGGRRRGNVDKCCRWGKLMKNVILP